MSRASLTHLAMVVGVLVAALVLVLLLAVGLTSYKGRVDIRNSQIAGCERGKLDRTSLANAFRAQSDYLDLVLQAKSVQADVKAAALVNQMVQDKSATDLESRTGGRLDCRAVFPRPSLLP